MLTLDPGKRISAEEALAHPWIQQVARKEVSDVKDTSLVNALSNMHKFHASQKLAQAALLFMGSKVRKTCFFSLVPTSLYCSYQLLCLVNDVRRNKGAVKHFPFAGCQW